MNPYSTQRPNHVPFTHPPQNPNPPLLFRSFPNPPAPQPQQIPPSTTTPVLDLSTTFSTLTNLLSLSNQTLTSLSSQLTIPKPQIPNLIPCPYNPHHLMPPESLFLHSLQCPFPLFENPSSLFAYLYYPQTLNPQNSHKDSDLAQSIPELNNTELCISLDSYYNEFSSHFFYNDCPCAVNLNDLDSSRKTFALPGVLTIECANFDSIGGREQRGFGKNEFRILPSELWAIRREIEGWVDYPSVYSYSVFCAILRLDLIKRSDLRRWVIGHSPRYGVVIDIYMRDHISVLFRLCLKAIRKEALTFLCCETKGKILNFKCPVLFQVLMWIVSQLSVLYGAVNAKCFAIHILKQCLLEAANEVVLFPLEWSNPKESSIHVDANGIDITNINLEEPPEASRESKVVERADESVDGKVVIFLSQITGAVAALYERSILEVKIKGLRVAQQPPRYQRMAEHANISERADEERNKRPNYNAIIEHDGLPRKQSSHQDSNKTKTREELLAEERDYKRRRMSYRGKKLKRTTLQVMRDIIDEYMGAIKLAGGIGSFEKGIDEEGMSPKPPPVTGVTMDELRKGNSDPSFAVRAISNNNQKPSHSDHNLKSKTSNDVLPQDYDQKGRTHHGKHERVEYWSGTNRDRCGAPHSRSPESHRSHGQSHEQSGHQRERADAESTRSKDHEKRYSSKSRYYDHKSLYSKPESANNLGMRKNDQKYVRDRYLRHSHGNYGSNSLAQDAFDDRYDPTESHGMHEDIYTGSRYVRPEDICD